jgi:hypothetical protein
LGWLESPFFVGFLLARSNRSPGICSGVVLAPTQLQSPWTIVFCVATSHFTAAGKKLPGRGSCRIHAKTFSTHTQTNPQLQARPEFLGS